jgi:AraC-like DNA-binding protein
VAEWRHRRRIGGLLDRIAQLERARAVAAAERAASAAEGTAPANERTAPVAAARPPAAAPDPIEWLERAAQHEDAAGEPATLELRAIRAIRGRLGDPVQPADLARALYVSLRTLERRLNESLACSPGELILAVKMREARRLLEHGALQVQEVARRVGFDDPAHFARRFRAYSGIPPTAVLHRGAADRDARSVA